MNVDCSNSVGGWPVRVIDDSLEVKERDGVAKLAVTGPNEASHSNPKTTSAPSKGRI